MSTEHYTEVTNQSWGNRIGGSLKGILAGFFLFATSFPLLIWNEGRSVKQYRTLKEGAQAVVSVSADSINPNNAGKLVHIAGKADTESILEDFTFGISSNALKLRRIVEMYQWKEASERTKKKKIGGGIETTTTYTYHKVWSEHLIDSRKFKKTAEHQNPEAMPYTPEQQTAENVTVGAFTLPPSIVDKIDNFNPLPLKTDTPLPESLKGKVKQHNNRFYIGDDPAAPQIGDTRVTFEVAKPTAVSVIAGQINNTFEPYSTKAGGTIEMLQMGTLSAQSMMQQAEQSNKTLTWILRLVGFLIMLFGLTLIFKPLSVLADVIPLLGTLVSAGTTIIAFLSAAILSLVTIAIAWVIYRPILGIILVGIALILVLGIKAKIKSSKQSPKHSK